MRKILTLALLLLISAVCLQAQAGYPESGTSQTSGKASDMTTIEGCLQSSMGQYTLIDKDGAVHQLSGAANKLGHQVGHQVELTGKPGIRTIDSTPQGAGSSAAEQAVLEVKSVKQIATTCKSAGN
jgi:hypothetical protein